MNFEEAKSKLRRKKRSWHNKLWTAQKQRLESWKETKVSCNSHRSFQIFSDVFPAQGSKCPSFQRFLWLSKMVFQRLPWISQVFVGVTIQASKISYSQPKVAAACFAKASFRQAMMTRNPASWKFGPKKTTNSEAVVKGNGSVWWLIKYVHNILIILIHLIQHACIV